MANTDTADHDFDSFVRLNTEVRWLKLTVTAAGFVCGSLLAISRIHNTPAVPMSDKIWTQFFTDLTIVVYYFSWIGGVLSDMNAQHDVSRRLSRSPVETRASAAVFVILLAGLFYLLRQTSNLSDFILVFGAILVVDVGSWWFYLKRILEPQFAESRRIAVERSRLVSALETDVVWDYMRGQWRTWRWCYAFVGLFVIWAIVHARLPVSWRTLPMLTDMFSEDSLFALLFFLYLLILEAWIWTFRICRQTRRAQLKELDGRYVLRMTDSPPNKGSHSTGPSLTFSPRE